MVSKEQIAQWKDLYGKVFKVTIKEIDYIYRRPNLGEMLSLQATSDESKIASYILGCILSPGDTDSISPGEYIILRQTIEQSTVLKTEEDLNGALNNARTRVNVYINNLFFSWKIFILKVFSSYKFKDLDEMQIEDFFDLLVLAEHESSVNVTSSKPQPTNTNSKFPGAKEGKFLSKKELDEVAVDISTEELNKIYNGPKHQTIKQIKSTDWKESDVPAPSKKEFPPSPNLINTRKK